MTDQAPVTTQAEPEAHCLDCGAPLKGDFCSRCGQRRELRPLSLVALLWDLLVEVLDTDARVWSTLRMLVLRPGQLTLDWMAGRRARHVPPLRLYLVLNLIAFLVISQQAGPIEAERSVPANAESATGTAFDQEDARLEAALADATAALELELEPEKRERVAAALEQVRAARSQRLETASAARESADAATAADETEAARAGSALGDDAELEEIVAFLQDVGYSRERSESALKRILEDPREFLETAFEKLPTVMILLLPVLAMAMRLLYLFSGRPFIVHLVGLAHLHAFIFLLILLVEGFMGCALLIETMGLASLADTMRTTTAAAGTTALFAYGLLWLRRLYGHSWWGAVGMSLTIMLMHLVGVTMGVAVLLAGSLVMEVVGNG